jgi:hypothetical protein
MASMTPGRRLTEALRRGGEFLLQYRTQSILNHTYCSLRSDGKLLSCSTRTRDSDPSPAFSDSDLDSDSPVGDSTTTLESLLM